jgi:prepilin-type N-terminal cleavage/methylation domain-containing protein
LAVKLEDSRLIRKIKSRKLHTARKGYTLFELMLALGIVGILALVAYPSILNSLKTRSLENEAREIQSIFHTAKFQAVKSKLYHRVVFELKQGTWTYYIEREDTPNDWNMVPGFTSKMINEELNVTVNFPSDTVVFSPLGFVSNFAAGQNTITLQSNRLQQQGQPDERILSVFAGGSIKYIKM